MLSYFILFFLGGGGEGFDEVFNIYKLLE